MVLTLLEGNTTRNSSQALWNVLARAHAVERLSGGQAELGFTIGLLSGAADLLGSTPGEIAEHSGVGPEVLASLVNRVGAAGRALTAVLGVEQEDWAAVVSTGLEPGEVSRVCLTSVSDSLQVVNEFLQT